MTDAEKLVEQAKRLLEHERNIERIMKNHPEWFFMAEQLGVTTERFIDESLRSGFIDNDWNLTQNVIDGEASSKETQGKIKLLMCFLN